LSHSQSMHLSTADREQLQRASEAMLHPFDHAGPVDYLVAVSRQVQPLLGAFAAMCGTRDPSGGVALDSGEWPSHVVADFARWKLNDEGTRRAVASGLEVAMMRSVIGDAWEAYHADTMVREWYKPNGVLDAGAYVLHWPEDDAMATIELHGRTFGTPRFGAEGEILLSLLLPSFKAGARLLFSLGRQRQVLAQEMDGLGVLLAVCARDGHVVHLSESLRLLLEGDSHGDAIRRRIAVVAQSAARSAYPVRRTAHALPSSAVHQIVSLGERRYRLSAAVATHTMHFGLSDILVSVAELPHAPDQAAGVAERFALSKRELDVARLLADGARNDAIATALGISPHTVRRHTERVLAKLGVSNRAAAAARLRGLTERGER